MNYVLFGATSVLVAAKFIGKHRRQRPGESVDYFHLVFDEHIVMKADGVWVESLFLGDVSRGWIAAQRTAGTLREGDPAATDAIVYTGVAHPCLKCYEAMVLGGTAVAA